jgi:hypothetical protein
VMFLPSICVWIKKMFLTLFLCCILLFDIILQCYKKRRQLRFFLFCMHVCMTRPSAVGRYVVVVYSLKLCYCSLVNDDNYAPSVCMCWKAAHFLSLQVNKRWALSFCAWIILSCMGFSGRYMMITIFNI